MRISPMLLVCLFAAVLPAQAQLTVEMVLDQDQYLPGEELLAGVRIVNRSGQTLHLGEEADWVEFSIEKMGGGVPRKLAEPPVQGGFDLESTKRATVRVDVSTCYNLREPARYYISASVKVKEWNKALIAKPVPFDIIEGTKLWEQAVGVPGTGGAEHEPVTRKYTLQEANYLKNQLRLYLRVSTADGDVVKLLNIGPMISFGRPEPLVDGQSRLHLFYQNGARSFAYVVVDTEGDIKTRQTYEYTESRPRLRLDDGGKIAVVGGARRLTDDDLPAATETKTNAVSLKP